MEGYFFHDARLGIPLPSLEKDWEEYNMMTQQEILLHWEAIRGQIPDRIASLENVINQKLAQLSDESDFMQSCRLNNEIAELASVINDLWIWYRSSEDTIESKLEQ
ncbi:hypothetical protein [Neobacillus sp. LXY-4]|uniref:hypothetical protein n=1 Tax=Neobacillus sp. LXY-4 TaxID=3379826 RepID=UPI003EDF36EC